MNPPPRSKAMALGQAADALHAGTEQKRLRQQQEALCPAARTALSSCSCVSCCHSGGRLPVSVLLLRAQRAVVGSAPPLPLPRETRAALSNACMRRAMQNHLAKWAISSYTHSAQRLKGQLMRCAAAGHTMHGLRAEV